MKSYLGQDLQAGSRASVVVKATGMTQELPPEDESSILPQILASVVGGIIVVIGAITLMIRPRKKAKQT